MFTAFIRRKLQVCFSTEKKTTLHFLWLMFHLYTIFVVKSKWIGAECDVVLMTARSESTRGHYFMVYCFRGCNFHVKKSKTDVDDDEHDEWWICYFWIGKWFRPFWRDQHFQRYDLRGFTIIFEYKQYYKQFNFANCPNKGIHKLFVEKSNYMCRHIHFN